MALLRPQDGAREQFTQLASQIAEQPLDQGAVAGLVRWPQEQFHLGVAATVGQGTGQIFERVALVRPGVVEREPLRNAETDPGERDAKLGQVGLGPDGVAEGALDALDTGCIVAQKHADHCPRVGVNEQGEPQRREHLAELVVDVQDVEAVMVGADILQRQAGLLDKAVEEQEVRLPVGTPMPGDVDLGAGIWLCAKPVQIAVKPGPRRQLDRRELYRQTGVGQERVDPCRTFSRRSMSASWSAGENPVEVEPPVAVVVPELVGEAVEGVDPERWAAAVEPSDERVDKVLGVGGQARFLVGAAMEGCREAGPIRAVAVVELAVGVVLAERDGLG